MVLFPGCKCCGGKYFCWVKTKNGVETEKVCSIENPGKADNTEPLWAKSSADSYDTETECESFCDICENKFFCWVKTENGVETARACSIENPGKADGTESLWSKSSDQCYDTKQECESACGSIIPAKLPCCCDGGTTGGTSQTSLGPSPCLQLPPVLRVKVGSPTYQKYSNVLGGNGSWAGPPDASDDLFLEDFKRIFDQATGKTYDLYYKPSLGFYESGDDKPFIGGINDFPEIPFWANATITCRGIQVYLQQHVLADPHGANTTDQGRNNGQTMMRISGQYRNESVLCEDLKEGGNPVTLPPVLQDALGSYLGNFGSFQIRYFFQHRNAGLGFSQITQAASASLDIVELEFDWGTLPNPLP